MKTALVTGGNSGIGYATAKYLVENGYSVTILGRNRQGVESAAEELNVRSLVVDMGDFDGLSNVAELFDSGLDILVNNAAVAKFMPIDACTETDYDLFFNVNVRGPMRLTGVLLPALIKSKGAVVNVSSAVVNNGIPNAALYAATKGGIEAMTKSLSLELAGKGVRVNAVSLGAFDTPIITKLGLPEEMIAAVKSQTETRIPMGRYGQSEEAAKVIFALAKSTYVTGAIWSVDGGVGAA